MPLTSKHPLVALLFEVGQAMFHYCDQPHKLPVGIIHSFNDDGNLVIGFAVASLPPEAQMKDSFAGELFFYRKNITFWVTVTGVAEIYSRNPLYIRFTIQKFSMHNPAVTRQLVTQPIVHLGSDSRTGKRA